MGEKVFTTAARPDGGDFYSVYLFVAEYAGRERFRTNNFARRERDFTF